MTEVERNKRLAMVVILLKHERATDGVLHALTLTESMLPLSGTPEHRSAFAAAHAQFATANNMTLPHPPSPAGLDLMSAENVLAYHCSVIGGTPDKRRSEFLALKPETIAAEIRKMGVDRAGALLYAACHGDTLEESAALVGALLAIYDAGMRPLLLTS